MKLHANAQTCPHCRTLIVESVIHDRRSASEVAASFRVSAVTVHKWLRRYRVEGSAGLRDRTSRPHQSPRNGGSELEPAGQALGI